jgi:hypothetical protein
MNEASIVNNTAQQTTTNDFEKLLTFGGEINDFWPCLFAYLGTLSGAKAGLTAVQTETGEWRQIAYWPKGTVGELGMRRAAAEAAPMVLQQGTFAGDREVDGFRGAGTLLGVRLPIEPGMPSAVLFLHCEAKLRAADISQVMELVRHAIAAVVTYACRNRVRQVAAEGKRIGAALDLLGQLRNEKRFVSACMRFCNEIAGHYGCDRVSIGWVKGNYIRLIALSHAENFEKRMEAVRRMEIAMEEALDQDEEILWPIPSGIDNIAREHAALAREQGAENVVSIPLRDSDEPIGVFTCERKQPFSPEDVAFFRLLADQAGGFLADLRQRDRWFGMRWWLSLRKNLSQLMEPRHVGIKLLAVASSVILALFLFLPLPFSVQSTFILKADEAVFIPAPFDGYIAEVLIEPGESMQAGQLLLRLDIRELLLEEAAALADLERYRREAELARADNRLASMRIAEAQAEQARVRLELSRHRIDRAGVKAPMNGVLVEGDLRDRTGAPVRQGDLLMRAASIEGLSVQIEIDQRDVQEVHETAGLRLAFAGRPNTRIAAILERIEPQAEARDGRNVFIARARFEDGTEPWMRPGMTGIGKVSAGKRSAAWIVSRRTIDFLRMHLWW